MYAARAGRRSAGSRVQRSLPMANALEALWTAFSGFAPRLVGAGLVLVLSFLVARILQRLGTRFLQRIGLDDLFESTGAAASLQRVGFGRSPSFVIGYVLFWGIVLAGVAAALSILGLASLQRNMDLIVALAGKALQPRGHAGRERGLEGWRSVRACGLRFCPHARRPGGGGATRHPDLDSGPPGRDTVRYGGYSGRSGPRPRPGPALGKHRRGPLRAGKRHTSGR